MKTILFFIFLHYYASDSWCVAWDSDYLYYKSLTSDSEVQAQVDSVDAYTVYFSGYEVSSGAPVIGNYDIINKNIAYGEVGVKN